MRTKVTTSLVTKLSALTISLILVTSAGISSLSIRSEINDMYDELLHDGRTAAAMAALNSEYGVYADDRKTLTQVVESLSLLKDIAYVAIRDAAGRELVRKDFVPSVHMPAALQMKKTGQAGTVLAEEFTDEESGERYVDVIAPVVSYTNSDLTNMFGNGKRNGTTDVIGSVRLGLTQESLGTKTRELILAAFFLTSAFLFVGIALTVILTRRITLPLKDLNKATRAISKGDLDYPLEITTHDEVADLARAFDHMLGNLRDYRDQVDVRTDELTETNTQLRQEIQARKVAEQQLLHDAFHDALTDLPNRALFMDRLSHAIAIAKRRKDYLFAVLFLDLDRFKVINDSLGHLVGDKLLVALGQRIQKCLRPGDTVARLGGDEFAILLEDIKGLSNAMVIGERIEGELAESFDVAGHEVFTTGSIGIALSATGYELPEQILRDADTAMYQAKAEGRARKAVFEPGMHVHAVERLRLETDLRRADERNEFVVYYQPVLSLKTNGLIGYEALVRWEHPERGLLSPADFIQVAEETGIIVAIDRFVLREACRQMCEWQKQLPENALQFISVNISNKQLAQPDLVEHISRVLNETGLSPSSLKLEITENVIIENPAATAAMLSRLRDLGIQLYIDDFGTGYSSLSYLYRLPIDGLKIDRSFIKRLGEKGENQEIVKTILALAHELNLDVIAEGVESDHQLSQIDALECEHWQGFLFSKPVESRRARALVDVAPEVPGARDKGSVVNDQDDVM